MNVPSIRAVAPTHRENVWQERGGRQGRIQDFKLGGRTLRNCAERREARNLLGYSV
jgi:hypothetical protein